MRIKAIVLKVSYLWVDGMALFPFVFIKKENPSPQLLNHELIHLRQQLELGIILFYCWYLIEYAMRLVIYQNHFKAYFNISFEREAYTNESNSKYLQNRKFWGFLKYMFR